MSLPKFFSSALITLSVLYGQDGPKPQPGALTIEEIVRHAKSGISEELIVTIVKRNARAFNLNSEEIVELKRTGVSETVIKFLLNPSLPYSPPAPAALPPASDNAIPPARAPEPEVPADPIARKVPTEPGVYLLGADDTMVPLDSRPLVPSKQTGKISTVLSGGLLKGRIIGSAVGARARTRAAAGENIFYARLGDKASLDDLTLVILEIQDSRRDLDFGTKPGAPAFPLKSVVPFESKEVSPKLFRLVVSLDKPGEYFFLILGSGDEKKGTLGKGYDFGIK